MFQAKRGEGTNTYYLFKYVYTFAACDDRNIAWTGTAIEDDRFLNPGNEEVGALTNDGFLNSPESVKYHCPMPCVHCWKKNG